MSDTLPSNSGSSPRPKRKGKESAVGMRKHKRTATDVGLALVTPLVGQEFLDRYKLRDPLNRGLKYGVKQVFSVAGAASRQFKRASGTQGGPTRLKKISTQTMILKMIKLTLPVSHCMITSTRRIHRLFHSTTR